MHMQDQHAASASPPSAATRPDALTPTEERNLRAVTDVLQFWNAQDIDGMFDYYHDDIVWQNAALNEVYRGKDEVRAFLQTLFTAFPDLHFVVDDKFARDDRVSERWTIHGTHLGPFMGVPATGKRMAIRGVGMVQMRDGKFAEDWYMLDIAGCMQQMGLMPPLTIGNTRVGQALLWGAVNARLVAGAIGGAALGGWVLRRTLRE